MKARLITEGLILLLRLVYAIGWLEQAFDTWAAQCRPDDSWSTFVWHEHRFLRWRWLSTHTQDGIRSHQMIRGNAESLRASGEHIHMRVYPAGSRLDE